MESSTAIPHSPQQLAYRGYRDTKITAMALSVVALVALAGTFFLWGMGTSPGMMLTGVNFLPYMVGTLLGAINIGIVVGVALCAMKMGYHRLQMKPSDST